jgi:hypothetical protein
LAIESPPKKPSSDHLQRELMMKEAFDWPGFQLEVQTEP